LETTTASGDRFVEKADQKQIVKRRNKSHSRMRMAEQCQADAGRDVIKRVIQLLIAPIEGAKFRQRIIEKFMQLLDSHHRRVMTGDYWILVSAVHARLIATARSMVAARTK